MASNGGYFLTPIGFVRSELKDRRGAPRQGREGAPDAWVEIDPNYGEALDGVTEGSQVILLTWLHRAHREVMKVRPRNDPRNPITGVFATRSPDRPNPIGLHQVEVLELAPPGRMRVGPLEAVDGTPVIDIKPVLPGLSDF